MQTCLLFVERIGCMLIQWLFFLFLLNFSWNHRTSHRCSNFRIFLFFREIEIYIDTRVTLAPVEGADSGHSFDPAAEEDTELLMLLWLINSKLMPSFLALFIDKVSSFFHKSSRSRSRFLSLQKTNKKHYTKLFFVKMIYAF